MKEILEVDMNGIVDEVELADHNLMQVYLERPVQFIELSYNQYIKQLFG